MTRSGELSLDEFKARLPLAEIVGRHVRLTRRGRELVGLCPFHKEKTPSFTVVEDKGFYHCFGCGAHGNAVDFVMAVENLSFSEALERLAELAGLPAPARAAPRAPAPDPGLVAVQNAALRFFRRQLRGEAGGTARAYLARRGFSNDTIETFELGYAPPGRDTLRSALLAEGFAEPLLLEAGLLAVREEEGTSYDRFRHRLIFPIRDERGRLVGFGGRALGESRAKYLNSPETPLFRKGRLLFHLHRAREAARRSRRLLVVEGYTDVLSLAQAGLPEAVAPLGTALTPEQLRLLWRTADEPLLCFDGDAAGLRAAWRAALRALPLLAPGKSLEFVILPEGEDPDSLLRREGRAGFEALIEQRIALVDLLWRFELEACPPRTPERRAALWRRIRQLLGEIADPSVRRFYAEEWRARLQRLAPRRELHGGRPAAAFTRSAGASRLAAEMRELERELERAVLRPVLDHPELLVEHEEPFAAIELEDPDNERLRQEILVWYADRPTLDAAALRAHLSSHGFDEMIEGMLASGSRSCGASGTDREAIEEWREVLARLVRVAAQRREARMIDETLRRRDIEQMGARLESFRRLLNRMTEEHGARVERGPAHRRHPAGEG